jgi:hypothetical protein
VKLKVDEIFGFWFCCLLCMFSCSFKNMPFVKVTLKNTRILFYFSIANILVCALIFLFLMAGIRPLLINILLLEFFLFSIITLVYFVRILVRLAETTAVIAAYTMFICILFINIIDTVFPRLLNSGYSQWLSTLTEVIGLLVAFRSFFVKASFISLPFQFFGAGIGLLVLPRLYVMLVAANYKDELLSISGDIGILVVLLSTSFILKRMLDFQKTEQQPSATDEQDLTQP